MRLGDDAHVGGVELRQQLVEAAGEGLVHLVRVSLGLGLGLGLVLGLAKP